MNHDLLSLVAAQRQMITAHADFHGITERGEADELHRGPDQDAHLEQTPAAFHGNINAGDGSGSANLERGQRLTRGNHRGQATREDSGTGSTMIWSASLALMPSRALQTWQITLL